MERNRSVGQTKAMYVNRLEAMKLPFRTLVTSNISISVPQHSAYSICSLPMTPRHEALGLVAQNIIRSWRCKDKFLMGGKETTQNVLLLRPWFVEKSFLKLAKARSLEHNFFRLRESLDCMEELNEFDKLLIMTKSAKSSQSSVV